MEAIGIRIAKASAISPVRYNELALAVNQIIDSTAGPAEFWDVVDSRRKQLFLNDAESFLFGSMMCEVLFHSPNSVYFGKKLAKVCKVDYEKIISYCKR